MHTKTTTILALAASLALAATDEEQPARRRLRDTVDLTRVHEKAEAKALTGALSFKLDAAAAAKKGGADALTVKFVGTVASNGRLHALSRIISAFLAEHARRRGEVSAEVISAVEMDDARRARVEQAVSKLAGSDKLSLSMRVDPSLIGGLVVRIGSRMIDTSIRTKLNRLETAMKGMA